MRNSRNGGEEFSSQATTSNAPSHRIRAAIVGWRRAFGQHDIFGYQHLAPTAELGIVALGAIANFLIVSRGRIFDWPSEGHNFTEADLALLIIITAMLFQIYTIPKMNAKIFILENAKKLKFCAISGVSSKKLMNIIYPRYIINVIYSVRKILTFEIVLAMSIYTIIGFGIGLSFGVIFIMYITAMACVLYVVLSCTIATSRISSWYEKKLLNDFSQITLADAFLRQ